MNPQTLQQHARALYGERWRPALADALQVSPRTLRRWANGTNPCPDWLDYELKLLVKAKQTELEGLTP